MSDEERRVAARQPPVWSGDLRDDCTAKWAGFLLRAEKMDRGRWWYAVTDVRSGNVIAEGMDVRTGGEARLKCEEAIRRFLRVA